MQTTSFFSLHLIAPPYNLFKTFLLISSFAASILSANTQLVEREIQLNRNPSVLFIRNPEVYTAWKLELRPPPNMRARVNAPDSLGWSLRHGESGTQSSVVIGCGSNPAHAEIVWVGPEDGYSFHTTVSGILSGCHPGNRPGTTQTPNFQIDLEGGWLLIRLSKEYVMVGEEIDLSVVYAYTRDGTLHMHPVDVLWDAEASKIKFVDANGTQIDGMDRPRQEIQAVSLGHGKINVTAILEGGRVSQPLEIYEMAFLEDADTVYNFSPTMGEVAKLKYELLPPVNQGQRVPDLSYEIQIVRELQNGVDQWVDNVNVSRDENGWAQNSILDLWEPRLLSWNGIPHPITFGGGNVGNTIPQSTGGGEPFQGVNAQFHRILPAITVNQPVPPPLYTAKLIVSRLGGNPLTPVYEVRRNVFVPQVVRLLYSDQISYNVIMQDIIIPKESHNWNQDLVLYQTGNGTYDQYHAWLLEKIQQSYEGINIRFLLNNQSLIGNQYGEIRFITPGNRTSAGSFPGTFQLGGEIPGFHVRVHNYNIWKILESQYNDWVIHFQNLAGGPISYDPLTLPYPNFPARGLQEMAHAVAFVAVHEVGHALGLVVQGDVLDGDGTGHNKPPYVDAIGNRVNHIMNPGSERTRQMRFDLNQSWSWRELNFQYLKYIFPVE